MPSNPPCLSLWFFLVHHYYCTWSSCWLRHHTWKHSTTVYKRFRVDTLGHTQDSFSWIPSPWHNIFLPVYNNSRVQWNKMLGKWCKTPRSNFSALTSGSSLYWWHWVLCWWGYLGISFSHLQPWEDEDDLCISCSILHSSTQ